MIERVSGAAARCEERKSSLLLEKMLYFLCYFAGNLCNLGNIIFLIFLLFSNFAFKGHGCWLIKIN